MVSNDKEFLGKECLTPGNPSPLCRCDWKFYLKRIDNKYISRPFLSGKAEDYQKICHMSETYKLRYVSFFLRNIQSS